MSYVDPFGVSAVNPSDVSYRALNLTANATLEWPSFTTTGETTARILDVTTTAGLTISLPTAMQGSTGEDILFKNVGSNTFTILDYDGNTITTVVAGAAKYVYLTDVSTTAGVWTSIAFGVGSTTVDAASLVGYGVKAISASLNQSHPVTLSSISFTVTAADRSRLYLDTAGATITLPTAIGIGDDFFFLLRNTSVGTTVVEASGGDVIDGSSSISLAPEESCFVCCSGTGWYTVGRGRSTTFAYTQLTKNVAGSSDVTLSGTEAGYAILKFIGALTGNINVVVPNVTAVWYVDNSTTGVYSLTVKTAAGSGVAITASNRVILYCDGTNVLDAQTVFTTSGLFVSGSASVPSIAFSADTDTGFYLPVANAVGVAAGGVTVAMFNGSGLSLTTDLAITEGGTGASSASSARTNLGISATNTPSTPSGNLAATDVQAALNELQSDIDTRAVAAVTVAKTSDTGSAVLPVGTTAQRDGSPATGYIRYNTTIPSFEGYDGASWGSIGGGGGGGGATGGGNDEVFVENDTLVTNDYILGQGNQRSGATFTNGSANIGFNGHGFVAEQLVMFSNVGGTLPTNFTEYVGYYVIATGLTADVFQVSATVGGTAISAGSAGTGTHSTGKLKHASTVSLNVLTGKTVTIPTNVTLVVN
jgi:hypothetical protein